MRLVLDTHIFLWYITADQQLPATFRAAIQDPANVVYLSVASVWEAVIKYSLGKLPLPELPAEYLPHQRDLHRIASPPLTKPHSLSLPSCRRFTVTHSTASWWPKRSNTIWRS